MGGGSLPPPVRLTTARLIYAGPTVGKTTLTRMEQYRRVNFVDTDDLIREHFPDWMEKKLWRTASQAARDEVDDALGRLVRARLIEDPHSVVVTNLWGHRFRVALDDTLAPWEGRFPFGALRTSGQEVLDVSIQRGGDPIPLELFERWFGDWRRNQGEAVFHLVAIEPAEPHIYLSDVVTLDYGWLK